MFSKTHWKERKERKEKSRSPFSCVQRHLEALQPSTLSEAEAYATITAALDDEWAIDNHPHIVYRAHYNEKLFGYMPLAMRYAVPEQLALAKELFGTDNPGEATAIRDARIEAERGVYWIRHLDATRTRIALVNTMALLPAYLTFVDETLAAWARDGMEVLILNDSDHLNTHIVNQTIEIFVIQ